MSLSKLPKTGCRYMCEALDPNAAFLSVEPWGQHWGLSVALDGIAAYQYWISRMVMPIVFQWIEENHEEVYANIPVSSRDDIEKVIQAAFNIVKTLPAYEAGQAELKTFEARLASRTADTSPMNPTWAEISGRMREEMREVLTEESRQLAGVGS
jgi:hypothetical protein